MFGVANANAGTLCAPPRYFGRLDGRPLWPPTKTPSGEIETLTTFPRLSGSFLCEGTRAAPQRYMDQAGWVLFGSRSPSDGETPA